jgi:hypothetical protein
MFSSCVGHTFIRQPLNVEPYSAYYIIVSAQGVYKNKIDWQKPSDGNGMNSIRLDLLISE